MSCSPRIAAKFSKIPQGQGGEYERRLHQTKPNVCTTIPLADERNPLKSDTVVEIELLQTYTLPETLPDWE